MSASALVNRSHSRAQRDSYWYTLLLRFFLGCFRSRRVFRFLLDRRVKTWLRLFVDEVREWLVWSGKGCVIGSFLCFWLLQRRAFRISLSWRYDMHRLLYLKVLLLSPLHRLLSLSSLWHSDLLLPVLLLASHTPDHCRFLNMKQLSSLHS